MEPQREYGFFALDMSFPDQTVKIGKDSSRRLQSWQMNCSNHFSSSPTMDQSAFVCQRLFGKNGSSSSFTAAIGSRSRIVSILLRKFFSNRWKRRNLRRIPSMVSEPPYIKDCLDS
ncbi:hypothetical protein M9H77_17945 [Catharanthus roseus]|uniref:Uncharacterized protein n=1 Tax=Catharanthus roseus TaxID=4058 RepID=A0ACC0B6A0_CATRO|nr:hypothetical protein M9H77_17945 [Catharanthus roseus]